MRSRRSGATAPAARAPSGGRLCFISVRPINTCSAPFEGLIPLFSFCADSLQDRNKWWRQFWRRVSDYQPVLMRRRDGRQRCHRSCEVLSSNVSARAQCIHLRLLNEGMTCLPRPRRPATPGKRVQALGPRRSLLALRSTAIVLRCRGLGHPNGSNNRLREEVEATDGLYRIRL
jgi:hypothetical protein